MKSNLQFLLSLVILLTLSASLWAQEKITHEEYIEKYKAIAIEEMHDYKIPASITLAQGLLESGSGNSSLAKNANNHFGIKCHKGWSGDGYYMDDDEENECFRVYSDPDESYRDHSKFLTTRGRYSSLFELKITDYKGWARGLKSAGYATNPKYPTLLITLIERYNLDEYDSAKKGKNSNKKPTTNSESIEPYQKTDFLMVDRGGNNRDIFLNNRVKFIYAREGDNYLSLAEEFKIYPYQILKCNELDADDKIVAGEKIYITKKKSKAEVKYHIVRQGESMRTISQTYGIRLKTLYKKNRMKFGEVPTAGQKLWLRTKRPK